MGGGERRGEGKMKLKLTVAQLSSSSSCGLIKSATPTVSVTPSCTNCSTLYNYTTIIWTPKKQVTSHSIVALNKTPFQ